MPIKWQDVGAFGAGALDELLLGAPEWLLKNLGNRKAVEDYIKTNKSAYKAGEVAGTVGGALVPWGAVAKGAKGAALGAKALKAADVGTDIVRAGDTALDLARGAKAVKGAATIGEAAKKASLAKELLKAGAKGSAWGGAEAAARGVFDEEDPGQVLRDVQQGTLWGGLGGAGGLALGKGLKYLGKGAGRLTDEAIETGKRSFIGRTPLRGRQTAELLRDISGPGAKGLGKFNKSEEALDKLYSFAKSRGLQKAGMEDVVLKAEKAKWGKIDDAFEQAFPDARGSEIIDKAIDWDELERISKLPGGDVAIASLEKILKDTSGTQGLANIRNYLSDVAKSTFKATDEAAGRAQRELANMLRRNVDEIVMDTAEKSGLDIDFKKLKEEYLPARAYGEAFARETVSPLRLSTGSPTLEKLAMAGLGAGAGATQGQSIDERVKNAILGGATGFAVKKGAEKAIDMLRGASVPALEKLARVTPKIEKAAEKIVPEALTVPGARLAANVVNEAAKSTAPETEGEAVAAQDGAEVGAAIDTPQYTGLVMSKLRAFAEAEGIDPAGPDFREFVEVVGASTIGDSGPFDPAKLAPMLYPDPDERKKFTQALGVSRRLSANVGGALKAAPMFGIGESTEESIARQSALDQLSTLVGDVAKDRGTEKAAKKQLDVILKSRAGQKEKERMIRGLLETYGIDFETLGRVGVNV